MFCISCLTLNLPLNEQRKSQINLPLFFQPWLIRCQNNCNYSPIISPNPYEYVLKCVTLCYQDLFVSTAQLFWNFHSISSVYTSGKMYETSIVLERAATYKHCNWRRSVGFFFSCFVLCFFVVVLFCFVFLNSRHESEFSKYFQ